MDEAHFDREQVNPRSRQSAVLHGEGLVDVHRQRIPCRAEGHELMLGYDVGARLDCGAGMNVLEKNVVHLLLHVNLASSSITLFPTEFCDLRYLCIVGTGAFRTWGSIWSKLPVP